MDYQIFYFFNDSNTSSKSEKIMNLLFLDSEMRSRAMLIAQASALNIEVLFGRCFFLNISPLCIVAHPVIFSSLDLSMKMCKCLGYLSLTFSNSSWEKLEDEFCFSEIYRVLSLCLEPLWSKVEYLV